MRVPKAAAALDNRIRLEGGANVLVPAQAAGVRRYLRQSVAFCAIPGPGALEWIVDTKGRDSVPSRVGKAAG